MSPILSIAVDRFFLKSVLSTYEKPQPVRRFEMIGVASLWVIEYYLNNESKD